MAPMRPNILFIFTDDHAAHAISAYGSKVNTTPHMDRLAREGALFRNMFCGNSICSPSRATILTGKHSHMNGVTRWQEFDGSQYTFPKQLKAAGYATALFGKWHLTSAPTGFDEWMVYPGQGQYYNPDFITPEGRRRIEGYGPEITTDMSLDFLDRHSESERPFLLMCHFKAPHRTWLPGPGYLTQFDDVDIPEPETLFDDYSDRSDVLKDHEMGIADHLIMDYDLKVPQDGESYETVYGVERMTEAQRSAFVRAYKPKNDAFLAGNLTGDDLTRWKYQRYMKDYLRVIAAVDDSIGRLLEALDRHGLAENTIVVYSSDQGFYLGDHGWYDKRWMFEESLRMPFLMRWPGRIEPGTEIEALTHNIDFAPTFIDAAGLEPPAEVQGESFLPLLEDPEAPWRDAVYYHYYDDPCEHGVAKHYGIRTHDYKLMYYYAVGDWDMFDLRRDPQELTSVFGDPQYASIRDELMTRLRALREVYRDTTGTAST